MRLFPIISVAMRVAVMAKPTLEMEDDGSSEDLLAGSWGDSGFDSSDSNSWADTPNKPKVIEETKKGINY